MLNDILKSLSLELDFWMCYKILNNFLMKFIKLYYFYYYEKLNDFKKFIGG